MAAPAAPKPLTILVVDDHFVVRRGLKTIIAEKYPTAVFGDGATAQEGFDLAFKAPWDIALIDISLPGRGGLELLRDLRQHFPKLPVVVVSMLPEEQFALRVIKLGACAYIRKDSAGQELIAGIEAGLRGAKYITPSIAERLAVNLEKDQNGHTHEALSDREYQVMCLIASGKTVKEVGGTLSLSVKTISTYRTRILAKMNLKNSAQIMRYAVRHQLIDSETEQC